ncbi:amidohydrolase [Bacillaceae bacterium CLA-AA-H227]|uniref:Amidohydrolase n=1 Tax=Robertmurraya yapensis (ex Hitch et al 2024) TaxID=3133160 RepID=A0ACC6SAB3_9BACI
MATLWYGGPIYTLQGEEHLVEAVVTEGDKIIGLGSIEELENSFKITIKHNLNGSTMLPGFVDSHIHLIGHGEKLVRLDLSSYRSKQEVLQAVKEYAVNLEDGEWVIGEGWNENQWDEPAPIIRKELDEIVSDRPVLLKRVCRHAMVVNSVALKAASIDKHTECPPGGVLGKDKDGELNGIFKENAQDLMLNAMPNPSEEYLRKALRTAIADAHQKGLTGVHTEDLAYYNGFEDTYNLFQHVIEGEGSKIRAHLLVNHEVMNDFKSSGGAFLKGSKWVEFGAIKIFTDGSLGGRTALLSHPYADDPTTNGVAIFPQNELNELVARARRMNMPVAIHAIGDLAFEMALQAIEEHPLKGAGIDRLIHAQILRLDLIERAKKLPVILDIQPSFVASDFPWVIERVGEDHMEYCYAWKTLNEHIPCAGGSDAPVEEIAPLLGIQAAVTRTNHFDLERKSYLPEEALSVYDAVCLYTKGSAMASCHEEDRGMIKEGFLADFTILAENIFNIDSYDISRIQVDMTVIGGEVVFARP